ncbi:class I SAM-dependent RNA methyltransferase [Desulfoplanes sp. PS50]|jgi:23S rRNA (uracil1939-C5)-methyltransferase
MTMLHDLTIEKILWRGRGLARLESGKAVIVEPGVLPGEVVDAEILREKKDYIAAEPIRINQPSPLRRPHPCPHSSACGGCRMGILPASKGLDLKKDILKDTLIRSLRRHMDVKRLPSIQTMASPRGWRYRYRGQIHVHNHLPHFQKARTNDPVRLDDCLLLARPLARALQTVSAGLPDGRFAIAASPKDHRVCSQQDQTSLALPLSAYGFDLIQPGGNFFQANWELNQSLIHLVTQAVSGHERIADLYAGAGNFSLPLAFSGARVLAVESVPAAAHAGTQNAKRLGLTDLSFKTGDLSEGKTWKTIGSFNPTAVVLDPPRTGARHIASRLMALESLSTMAWVSCDIVTTCRDLTPMLKAGWTVREIILVDMFPQTWHMETVFILEKNFVPGA